MKLMKIYKKKKDKRGQNQQIFIKKLKVDKFE